jgi:hypothetical protein
LKYKISFTTYSVEIVEAFETLGNKKSQFIEQALLHFLGTAKGQETLTLMNEPSRKVSHNAAKKQDIHSKTEKGGREESGKINIDNFLA